MNALAFKLRDIDFTEKLDIRWIGSAMNLLAVFQNSSFINRNEFHVLMKRLNINRYFVQIADLDYAEIFHDIIFRSLNVLAKLKLAP